MSYRDTTWDELRLERDLYRRLLDLGACDDPQPFLQESLALISEVTRAKRGYLALFGEDHAEAPRWWISRGFSDDEVRQIRQKVSGGIIAEAIATGQVIQTASALSDPRFQSQESVQVNDIKEVLCAPIGGESAIGVLYLQERASPSPFSEADVERAALFARHIAPYLDRLRLKEQEAPDHTQPLRQRLKLGGLIGQSLPLSEVFAKLESAARFTVPVLLTGPSGVGKTALARAIHENSARANKPFLELNCAAIPEGLFESELFGALPGAHSTATKKIIGKVAAANGGTLFLDEIGDLSLNLQSKLLQFLQSKEYFPLGSATPEKANVRLIAATNTDLEAAVSQKSFRSDLFYRLNVFQIRVPSIEERREDIAPLARYFCQLACENNEIPGLSLSPMGLLALQEAEWPGNIRQLAHIVEAATIRAAMEGTRIVEPKHLFPDAPQHASPAEPPQTFQSATRSFQKRLVLETLEATDWNISETARRLDLTRTYVRQLIQAFGLRDLTTPSSPS